MATTHIKNNTDMFTSRRQRNFIPPRSETTSFFNEHASYLDRGTPSYYTNTSFRNCNPLIYSKDTQEDETKNNEMTIKEILALVKQQQQLILKLSLFDTT